MNKEKNIFALQHVIKCIEKIEVITKDLSYKDYLKEWIKQDAINKDIKN
jgi:uncharacterized protein with HEPN domain